MSEQAEGNSVYYLPQNSNNNNKNTKANKFIFDTINMFYGGPKEKKKI